MGAPEAFGPGNDAMPHDPGQTIFEEPADLEKLGRERPKCFRGAWTEISFCLSIFMSQILAVSQRWFSGQWQNFHTTSGILYLRLKCPPSNARQGARPSRTLCHMAVYRIVAGCHLDAAHFR